MSSCSHPRASTSAHVVGKKGCALECSDERMGSRARDFLVSANRDPSTSPKAMSSSAQENRRLSKPRDDWVLRLKTTFVAVDVKRLLASAICFAKRLPAFEK